MIVVVIQWQGITLRAQEVGLIPSASILCIILQKNATVKSCTQCIKLKPNICNYFA